MKRLSWLINAVEEGVISLLLVATTLLVFVEVILRFFFNTGVSWAQEVTLLLSAWMVLFGASYGIKVGSHIGVDAVIRLLSAKARRVVAMIACTFCLIYCGLFIGGAWVYMSKMVQIGIKMHDIPVPKWLAHSFVLVGFVLLAIRFVELMWLVYKGRIDGFQFADEAKEAMRLSEPGHQKAEGEAGR